MTARLSLQRLLMFALVLMLVLAAVRLLAIQGMFAPVRVVSGSMAERLLGERFSVTCYDCEFVFAYGVDSPPPRDLAVCPNCGFGANQVHSEGRRRGQRVLIDRAAYWLDAPARFDLAAFQQRDGSTPSGRERLVVKRIMGLPGEQLAIREGELYANKCLVRKSLAQFRQLAVVVHDNRFLPRHTPGIPARWRSETDLSGWRSEGQVLRYAPRAAETETRAGDAAGEQDADWLVYHHWRCYASAYPRTALAPVADHSGYNQAESRALQNVFDLVLRCEVTTHGGGHLLMRVHDGREWIGGTLDAMNRKATIARSDSVVASARFPEESDSRTFEVEFGIVDEQLILAVDRQELLRQSYQPLAGERKPTARPLAIGSRGLTLAIQGLLVRRDVYYLDPFQIGDDWQMPHPLGTGCYGVLGDNPSLSEDSRLWGAPGIPMSALSGRVLPLPW